MLDRYGGELMAVNYVKQKSVLEMGENGGKRSPKVWFDGEIIVNGLELQLPATTFYYRGEQVTTQAVTLELQADPDYAKNLYVYIDPTDPDGWLLDEVLQDGTHQQTEVAMLDNKGPVSGKVAWGYIPAAGTEIELTVLKHVSEGK